jgi:hypothetical protein
MPANFSSVTSVITWRTAAMRSARSVSMNADRPRLSLALNVANR